MSGKGPDKSNQRQGRVAARPRTCNSSSLPFYVDMMEPGLVQLLAPVLPPMARARTA